MANSVLFEGEQIYKLIPQRPPIVMVSHFYEGNDTDALTGLAVQEDNIFVVNGRFTEPGLIEHIAQSAAAFAGYPYFKRGEEPRLGYIGEIKKCKIAQLPKAPCLLQTTIHLVSEVMGVSLIAAETTCNGQVVTSTKMKIFIKD